MRKVLVVLSITVFWVSDGFAEGQHTPENPSLVLFLAGSAAMAYKYLRARIGK